ncbi:IS200/IS605 family transposase [Paludibacter sp.]
MSYTKLLYHIIIRTKANQPTLSIEHSDHLYRYIWGIIKSKKSVLYRINGTEDHLHLLVDIHPGIALSDFVRTLKAESSKMLKRTEGFERFTAWSEGFAALTYSLHDKKKIIEYIIHQREHHKKTTFREEFEGLLKEMGLVLDERAWRR